MSNANESTPFNTIDSIRRMQSDDLLEAYDWAIYGALRGLGYTPEWAHYMLDHPGGTFQSDLRHECISGTRSLVSAAEEIALVWGSEVRAYRRP